MEQLFFQQVNCPYCGELIDLGYADGMNAKQDIVHFLK